jgi:hypothetical protein
MVSPVDYVGMSVQHAMRLRENKLEGIAFSEVEYQGNLYQPTSFEDGQLVVWLLPEMEKPIHVSAEKCVITRPWPIPPPRVLRPSNPGEMGATSLRQRSL